MKNTAFSCSLRRKITPRPKLSFARSLSPLPLRNQIPHHLDELARVRRDRSAKLLHTMYRSGSSTNELELPLHNILRAAILDSAKFIQSPDYPKPDSLKNWSCRQLTVAVITQHAWLVQRHGLSLEQHHMMRKHSEEVRHLQKHRESTLQLQITELKSKLQFQNESVNRLRAVNSKLQDRLIQSEQQLNGLLGELHSAQDDSQKMRTWLKTQEYQHTSFDSQSNSTINNQDKNRRKKDFSQTL